MSVNRFSREQNSGFSCTTVLLDKLSLGKKERFKRLEAMAERALSSGIPHIKADKARIRRELREKVVEVQAIMEACATDDEILRLRDDFLAGLKMPVRASTGYVETIQGLPPEISSKGTRWLERIVARLCERVSAAMPALDLFCG